MDTPRPAPLYRAHVSDKGELAMRELPRWRGALARMRGRDVTIQIRRESVRRSLKANAYYWWGPIGALASWSGHEPDEIHEAMKAKFLPRRQVILPTGEVLDLPPSTATLDVEAFSLYVNQVIRFAAENGVIVPTAEEIA
jgi:hypothetical protein